MADVVIKVKFPPSSPVKTKSFRLSGTTQVKDAINVISESMKHTLAITPSFGMYAFLVASLAHSARA